MCGACVVIARFVSVEVDEDARRAKEWVDRGIKVARFLQ